MNRVKYYRCTCGNVFHYDPVTMPPVCGQCGRHETDLKKIKDRTIRDDVPKTQSADA